MTFWGIIFMAILGGPVWADPGSPLGTSFENTRRDYQEWGREKNIREVLPRDFHMLRDSSQYALLAVKAYIAEYAHLNVPAYKRYKYGAYLTDDGDLTSVQYLDWTKGRPVQSNRTLDVYVSGRHNMFQMESYNDVALYTLDGRFYRDVDGYLRSIPHRRLILGADNAPIYLQTNEPTIDLAGYIYENDEKVGQIKVVSFKNGTGIWTFDGTVYYQREPDKVTILPNGTYELIQGFYEEANKHPGRFSSSLMKPIAEGNANALKKIIESHEVMFKAVYDN